MGITRNNRTKIIIAAVAAGIVFAGIAVYRLGRSGTSSSADAAATYMIKRGDLVMSVTESGTIKARNAVEIKSQVEGQTTIVTLAPEGTYVTEEDVAAGKILVELDSSQLRDKMNQQKISYNSSYADYTDSRESLNIQKNQNDSDVQQGLMTVKFGHMDLQKYLGDATADRVINQYKTTGNMPSVTELMADPNQLGGLSLQRYRELTSNINLAEEEYKRANTDLGWTEKLFEKNYVSRSDLDADRLKAKRLQVSWEQAKTSLDLFERYEFVKDAEMLFSDYLEAEREMERIYARTRSRQAQAEARLSSAEARYLLEKEQLERIEKQIDACTMRATAPGLVIYASSDRSRWGGSRTNIEVGEAVREREMIMTITNADQMNVDVKVHETSIDKIRTGQLAKITVDAQPDKVFYGSVLKIAPLPDPQAIFGNPDLKVYTTDVSLETAGDSIKPGMSARVDIVIAELEDVISIPIQCVANRGGRKVCYVMTGSGPEEKVIETGVFNDRFVQVLGGLKEGQTVTLNPPRFMAGADGREAAEVAADIREKARENESLKPAPEDESRPAGPAAQQEPAVRPEPAAMGMNDRFRQMDQDGDGKISIAGEAPEQARQFLEPLDSNHDGFIDTGEMAAAAARMSRGPRSPGQRPDRPGRAE